MKIRIKLKIISSKDKPYFLETIGEYRNNQIIFKDKDEETVINFENIININKKTNNYTLNLNFINNEKSESLYEIKEPYCSINTHVFTKRIIKEFNFLKIEYDLFLENNKENSFEIELSWSNL